MTPDLDIGSVNGLPPVRHPAINGTYGNADLLPVELHIIEYIWVWVLKYS